MFPPSGTSQEVSEPGSERKCAARRTADIACLLLRRIELKSRSQICITISWLQGPISVHWYASGQQVHARVSSPREVQDGCFPKGSVYLPACTTNVSASCPGGWWLLLLLHWLFLQRHCSWATWIMGLGLAISSSNSRHKLTCFPRKNFLLCWHFSAWKTAGRRWAHMFSVAGVWEDVKAIWCDRKNNIPNF